MRMREIFDLFLSDTTDFINFYIFNDLQVHSINSFQFGQIHSVLVKKIKYRMFKAWLEIAWNNDTEPASSDIRTPRRISGNWLAPAPVLRLRCLGSGSGQWGGVGVADQRETLRSHMSCLVSATEASHFTVYFINYFPSSFTAPLVCVSITEFYHQESKTE